MSNAETVITALAGVFADGETEIDEGLVERMIAALEPVSSPDVVMVMRSTDEAFVGTYSGIDGLREGWADWLESFERVRFVLEGIEEFGDNVLTYGHQIGTTRTGGVEMQQPSAAVWKFRDGLLRQVEFHLDREVARASAREP